MEKEKQIRQVGFARKLEQRLRTEHPALAEKISFVDIQTFIEVFFKELSAQLKTGVRVIFEQHASFYTKAIKRKCTNMQNQEQWMTYKRRLRWTPAPSMKQRTEIELQEEEYLEEINK